MNFPNLKSVFTLFIDIDIRKAFEEEPENANAIAGDTILLRCSPPIGFPTPQVTWEKDGEPLDLSTNQRHAIIGDGSLELSDIDIADAGKYSCRAENVAYARRSKYAVVNVSYRK